MEALNVVALATLGSELALLEARREETSHQLVELLKAHKVQGEHLGSLHEQAARAHALLAQQQGQLTEMHKQLTQQQRRAIRLQGEVHAARLIQTERGRMQEALTQAEASRARAERQAAKHAAVERALKAEAAQEREASVDALERARAAHDAELQAVRGRLAELESLVARLLGDNTRVQLRSGGSFTVAEYVRTLQRKIEREQSQRPIQRGAADEE